MKHLERRSIQGLIIRGYSGLPNAVFLLLQFGNRLGFLRWLGAMAPLVSSGESDDDRLTAVHVALGRTGFVLTGLKPEDHGFSRPFHEGMESPVRADALGDLDESAPGNWAWGGIHGPQPMAVLLLYSAGAGRLEELEAQQRHLLQAHGGSISRRLDCGDMVNSREHFGFRDGIGQPVIRGLEREGNDHNVIEPGEFILGYGDEFGLMPPSPWVDALSDVAGVLSITPGNETRRDLGRNGTYLVFRQLQQDVAGFWGAVREGVISAGLNPDIASRIRLASKMVGRWPGGAPLTLSPHDDDPCLATKDRFGYRDKSHDDSDGRRCPFGAHIRRANPRDGLPGSREDSLIASRRHRVLRRGRSYGPPLDASLDPAVLMTKPDDEVERGLYFLCCNTDIERQFEFVQQTWIDNRKFAGLENDPDPVVAAHPPGSAFTVQAAPVRERYRSLPPFVQTIGGSYFFLPSIPALQYFGNLK